MNGNLNAPFYQTKLKNYLLKNKLTQKIYNLSNYFHYKKNSRT